ncbi:capZ-interacting protein isoform X2 [Corythoichthys intestinalis]|uniref:capZ-interacting protein isoform X2 n=1 Tax=Corythoichthys intestinalis TaxID=161448 RepID=UPI0025A4FC98|nr:capZ-interacting protein isoform X2 [Corythoichthys intestinalis]
MEDYPSKLSVAELAGRFKGHILPMMPVVHDEMDSSPVKIRTKSSSIIERLQANLALSPTTLLPSPKGAELNRRPDSPPAAVVTSPPGPAPQPSVEEEDQEEPVSFDGPPESAPLPSFHKTRVRLSFKRRPPTRQHRRSAWESPSLFGDEESSPEANGDTVLQLAVREDEEDCQEARGEPAKTAPGDGEETREAPTLPRQTDGGDADTPH